jgi:hypothetical protein
MSIARAGVVASLVGLAALFPGAVRAAGDDSGGTAAARPASPVKNTVGTGNFFSLTHSASLDAQSAYATAMGGYDGARRSGLFEATAEVRVWGPFAVRGGAVYTGDDQKLRPSFGARVQALHENRHGVDGAFGVMYRPEGLTEAEGEIEAVLSAGAHLGKNYLLGNLVYGQDPEARERDGEIRLAGLRPVTSNLFLGFDGRVRFDLGSETAGGLGRSEPKLDALVGPAATFLVGPVAFLVHGGASALRVRSEDSFGVFFLAGAGTAF